MRQCEQMFRFAYSLSWRIRFSNIFNDNIQYIAYSKTLYIPKYYILQNMELSFVTMWTNVSFCILFDMTDKFWIYLEWQYVLFQKYHITKYSVFQNMELWFGTIQTNVLFWLFLDMTRNILDNKSYIHQSISNDTN